MYYREVGKCQKEVVAIQGALEQKRLEKHNLLLDCKVQDIEVVLLVGSLDNIIDVEVHDWSETWLSGRAQALCALGPQFSPGTAKTV